MKPSEKLLKGLEFASKNKRDLPYTVLDDKVVAFDCDDTLVMWKGGQEDYISSKDKVKLKCPWSGKEMFLTPHKKHIQKVKGYARSGWFVIIWSMGGGPWANEVSKALHLTEYASLIIGKPEICYDDMPLSEAFGTRKYLQDRKNSND